MCQPTRSEAFIKRTHERLLLPCARKLCNTIHQPVRCPAPWGAGAGAGHASSCALRHVPATCPRAPSPDPPETTHNVKCKGAVSIHNNENELAWTSLNETAVYLYNRSRVTQVNLVIRLRAPLSHSVPTPSRPAPLTPISNLGEDINSLHFTFHNITILRHVLVMIACNCCSCEGLDLVMLVR